MKRIHSIKNPDSFSDCISMLLASDRYEELNIDLASQRCFQLQFEPELKMWVHTALAVEECIQNLFVNIGIKLLQEETQYYTPEDIAGLAERGAVFGPIDRNELNQAVEDMYFTGSRHFVFLSDVWGEYGVVHDPDSSPCIMIELERLLAILNRPGVYCVTVDEIQNRNVDGARIMRQGIARYLDSPAFEPLLPPATVNTEPLCPSIDHVRIFLEFTSTIYLPSYLFFCNFILLF